MIEQKDNLSIVKKTTASKFQSSTANIDIESFFGPGMSGKDPVCPIQHGEDIPY